MRKFNMLVVMLSVVALAGCAGMAYYTPSPGEATAQILFPEGAYVRIRGPNGAAPRINPENGEKYALIPGDRDLRLSYFERFTRRDICDLSLRFHIDAGAHYVLERHVEESQCYVLVFREDKNAPTGMVRIYTE